MRNVCSKLFAFFARKSTYLVKNIGKNTTQRNKKSP
jgi:hypothetical protein